MMKPTLGTFALLAALLGFYCTTEGQSASRKQAVPAQAQTPSTADLRQRAKAGDPQAQYALFLRYEEGKSTLAERTEAVSWLRKAADAGHAYAQVTLGLLCKEGKRGVAENLEEAVQWFRKAADQGNPSGQSELGFMYERGEGVAKDEAEAVRWYTRAADQGLAVAKFDLAFMYENGRGVAADISKAIALYQEAALNIPTARRNLALIYYKGESVAKDAALAYMWALLDVSAEEMRILDKEPGEGEDFDPTPRLGHALVLLEDIAKSTSKKDKQAGRRLAEDWIQANATRLGHEAQRFPLTMARIKKK